MIRHRYFLFVLMLGLVLPAITEAAPRYRVEEIVVPGSGVPFVSGINNRGEVVGNTTDPADGVRKMWLYLPEAAYGYSTGVTIINIPGRSSQALSINDSGVIGGSTSDLSGPSFVTRGLLFQNRSVISEFNFTSDRDDRSFVRSVANNGFISGHALVQGDPAVNRRDGAGVIRNPGQAVLAVAGSTLSASVGKINSSGQAVAIRTVDGRTEVGTFDGTFDPFYSEPVASSNSRWLGTDINEKGQIVGITYDSQVFIYLPEPEYGLPAGMNLLFEESQRFLYPVLNDRGRVMTINHVWDNGEVYPASEVFPGIETYAGDTSTNSSNYVYGINNSGDAIASVRNPANSKTSIILLSSEDDSSVEITLRSSDAAEPDESAEPTDPGDDLEPDETAIATVTVTYVGETSATFSFPNGLLRAEDPNRLEIEEFEPVVPFTLTVEDPVRTFDVAIKPLTRGLHVLETDVTAVSTEGTEELSATKEFFMDPLQVTVQMKPLIDGKPIVNLQLDEEGNLTDENDNPVVPKVEVTVKNVGPDPVTTSIIGVDPFARDRSDAAARIRTVGEFPMDLGDIAPDAEISREIGIEVAADGRFEFHALLSAGVAGERPFNELEKGAPIAVGDPYPVELELTFAASPDITRENKGAFFLVPGSPLEIVASITNLTSNSTLEFLGVEAKQEGNVFGSSLTDFDGLLVGPPYIHDYAVEANASVVLNARITTAADGVPAGTVTWQEFENFKLVDDETGEETELTMKDVLITGNAGGWRRDPMAIRIIQDYSRPPRRVLSGSEYFANYSYGTLEGMGNWTYDTFDAIGGLGRVAGRISADPSLLTDALGDASRALWETAELIGTTWEEMSDAEKQEFFDAVNAEVTRRLALHVKHGIPVDRDDAVAVLNFTQQATYGLFGGVTQAYASDDPAQIAQLHGRIAGNVAMEVAGGYVTSAKFTKYIEAAELSKLGKSQDLVVSITKQEDRLRAIPSGPIDEVVTLKTFGPGPEDISGFQRVFKAFGVKGYARERSPIAYKLINELKEAIWKPEAMKPKGLSKLDKLILGDPLPTVTGKPPGNAQFDLEGFTGIFFPESDDIIRARVRAKGEPEEVVELALARAADRREEFQKYRPKFNEWKRDRLPVEKNYKDNGVPDPEFQSEVSRAFDFETIQLGGGKPRIYLAKMADENGALRFISGDIDWVHFSFLNGSPLDPATAAKLYTVLMRCCGLQHPETVSWILKGQTVFAGKANQIGEYLRGQKALLEVSEAGTRAVRVSEKLTRFAADGRNHLIFFDNGLKSRALSTLADVETAFADFQRKYPVRLVNPILWLTKASDIGDDTTLGGNEWKFHNTNGDEFLLRREPDGTIQRFNGTRWLPWQPPAANRSRSFRALAASPPSLSLTPTTSLDESTLAGETVLVINDLPSQWPDELAGRVDNWFEPGQRVVIAPGELEQEIRTIASINPLTLTAPLEFDHVFNTLVAVIPGSLTITPVSGGASKLLSTVIDPISGASMNWESLRGRTYQLELRAAAGSSAWIAVGDPITADGDILTILLGTSEYNANGTYRLRDTSLAVVEPPPTPQPPTPQPLETDSSRPLLKVQGRTKYETTRKRIVIRGKSTDASGIIEIDVRSKGATVKKVRLKPSGRFKTILSVDRDPKKIRVKITAIDGVGLRSRPKKLTIIRR